MAYIDNRSLAQIVQSQDPDPAYDFTVRDIIRDKLQEGKPNYYEDNRTTWDVIVAKTQLTLRRCRNDIDANTKMLEQIASDTANSRLPPTDKNYKKIVKVQQQIMDQNYAAAIDSINDDTATIKREQPLLQDYIWNQHLEASINRTMRYLRNKFMRDSDIDFLRRGVTWVRNHEKQFIGYVSPEEKEEALTAY